MKAIRRRAPVFRVEMPEELKGTGFPSFEQFVKNREKYIGHPEELLAQVDQSGHTLRHLIRKHIYRLELANGVTHECSTLEEMQKILANEGLRPNQMDIKPQAIPLSGGKCDMLVVFVPKMVITPQ